MTCHNQLSLSIPSPSLSSESDISICISERDKSISSHSLRPNEDTFFRPVDETDDIPIYDHIVPSPPAETLVPHRVTPNIVIPKLPSPRLEPFIFEEDEEVKIYSKKDPVLVVPQVEKLHSPRLDFFSFIDEIEEEEQENRKKYEIISEILKYSPTENGYVLMTEMSIERLCEFLQQKIMIHKIQELGNKYRRVNNS